MNYYYSLKSRCAYCGKFILKGQDICKWCGHERKDDDDKYFPHPYIFKPPGGGDGFKVGAPAFNLKLVSR